MGIAFEKRGKWSDGCIQISRRLQGRDSKGEEKKGRFPAVLHRLRKEKRGRIGFQHQS